MKTKRTILFLLTWVLALPLVACSTGDKDNQHSNMNHSDKTKQGENVSSAKHEGMDDMSHSGPGEVPKGLKEAANPKFKVGSTAIMNSNHMEGMKGAEATIVGAFDTNVYTISYTPTTGGEKVKNHKWVTESELSAK